MQTCTCVSVSNKKKWKLIDEFIFWCVNLVFITSLQIKITFWKVKTKIKNPSFCLFWCLVIYIHPITDRIFFQIKKIWICFRHFFGSETPKKPQKDIIVTMFCMNLSRTFLNLVLTKINHNIIFPVQSLL